MKNFIPVLLIIFSLSACQQGNKDPEARNIQLLTDSTVFTNNNIYSDSVAGIQNEPAENNVPEAPKAVVKSSHKKSHHTVAASTGARVNSNKSRGQNSVETPLPPVATPPVVNTSGTSNGKSAETVSTGNSIPDAGTPGEVKKEEKKGWSKAAQGAVIGGAAGAVGGAIISKKKGVGAVVGGIIGAAGGYIIGKNKDKKDNK